jgi:hypothetical protein
VICIYYEFFSIGDENSNEWMADDNIDDHIVKNHLEMIVDQVANDFSSPIEKNSSVFISSSINTSLLVRL